MHNVAAVLGRFLLSGVFFVSGFRKFEDPAATARRIAETVANTPWIADPVAVGVKDAAPLLAWAAIAFEWLGAFLLVTGLKKELGAALLLVFLVPTTILFHPPHEAGQLTQFLKNVAIMGGLLLVVAAAPKGRDRAL